MRSRRFCFWAAALAILSCAFAQRADAAGPDNDSSYVTTVYNERNGLPTGEANDVMQTRDGYIWIGSYGGLIRYDGTTFRNYSLEGALPSSSVRSLFEDSSGRLWIGTNDAGVFVMENSAITAVEGPETDYLCIRDFAEGKDGTIYIASNSGIAEIRDGVLTPYSGEYVSGETVYSIAVDGYGRLWGALNSGLCVVVKDGHPVHLFTSGNFLNGEEIYCSAADGEGRVYLGFSGSTLVRITPTDESLDPTKLDFERITTDQVTTHNRIRVMADGSVIVCGGVGSCVIGPDGEQLTLHAADRAASVNSACIDHEGNVWLASTSYGIIKYTKGYFTSPNAAAGLTDMPVNAVVEQDGCYYVATDSGLLAFDSDWAPVTNALTEICSGVRVRALLADSQQHVWAACYSPTAPLVCFDPASGDVRTYDTHDGLISTSTRALAELTDGRIAVGTQEGLNILTDGEVTASFGVREGLAVPSVLCVLESDSGTVLVGSDGGGIYEIDGDTVISHGFSEGLGAGVVLRILPDADGGGYFVSAGSALYYWQDGAFRLISNIIKGAGSIFDFYDRDGKLWILQNNGVLSYDKARLLAGEELRPVTYSFQHGLSGSLNANTWNWLADDGTLCIATRSGLSFFRFDPIVSSSPRGAVNDVYVDGLRYERPTSLALPADASRMTIDFAALTYTGAAEVDISYMLEGFDAQPTVVTNAGSENVSYTNLPGGEYTFRASVFSPDDPDNAFTVTLPITKEKTVVEYPAFSIVAAALIIAVTALIVILISRVKIRRAQARQSELRELAQQSLQTLAHTIDAKDRYTNGHSLRVAEYSRELARRMGKSEQEQENIYYIALLHDIGKIGVPDRILNKPGRLTDEERDIIQSHTTIGGEILKDFTALDGIADGAKYHHERYDGKGYSAHLAGKDIPEMARIIGVADTYDAMSSDRVYRNGLPSDVIVEELKKNAGTQFDPDVVPYVLQMIADGTAPIKTEHVWENPGLEDPAEGAPAEAAQQPN